MAARPTWSTPVDQIIMTTRQSAELFGRNKSAFEAVLGEDFDGKAQGAQIADRLDAREAAFQTERRDDVAWTNDKDRVVGRTGKLAAVFDSGVELAFFDDEDVDDVRRDFDTPPPSRIRTLSAAQRTLRTLKAATDSHRQRLEEELANFDRLYTELEELLALVVELGQQQAAESAETRKAIRERDQAKREALDFIGRVDLGAKTAALDHPLLEDELDAIYRRYAPHRDGGATGDDVDTPEPLVEPTEA